jgi:hypothetical protein
MYAAGQGGVGRGAGECSGKEGIILLEAVCSRGWEGVGEGRGRERERGMQWEGKAVGFRVLGFRVYY